MAEKDTEFDNLFLTVVNRGGGIDALFSSLYSFLRRQTDFFTNEPEARKISVRHFDHQFKLFGETERRKELLKKKQEEKKKKEAEEAAKRKQGQSEAVVEEVSEEEAARIMREQKRKQEEKNKPKEESPKKEPVKKEEEKKKEEKKEEVKEENGKEEKPEKKEGEEEEEDDKGPPLIGNGGTTDKYTWTQTLKEMTMYILLPNETTAKQVLVETGPTKVKVQIKGQSPIIDGKFPNKIKNDETIWTIETTKQGQKLLQL